MNDFIKNLFGIITVLISCYFAKKNIFTTRKLQFSEKQLYKVYLPLFQMVEPYLYKEAPLDFVLKLISTFNQIKSEHYELIYPNLIFLFESLNNSIRNNQYSYLHYENVCYSIDKDFEKLRNLLPLPTRSLRYKILYKQFPKDLRNNFSQFLKIIKNNLIVPLMYLLIGLTVFEAFTFIAEFIKRLFIINK